MVPPRWWQTAVFYQIYPRSFADGNGDGIGDFAGMTERLDYLQDLGIDAIWLSPHYPSPFLDCGYDIADYCAVGPEYGSLADFQTFLSAAHARGMHVILDLVLNHTSDQHPWFRASRTDRTNAYRDWYIWHDGAADGGPPNNWASLMGGSAWEWNSTTGQYYYHAFLKEQPDLNWRNPAVKAALWDAVRFWLDMGVDGFRLDAIATIYEDPSLPNHTAQIPPGDLLRRASSDLNDAQLETIRAYYADLQRYQRHQPGIHDLMRDLRALLDTYAGDRVLVGEEDDVAYHGNGDDELHLVFNFPLMHPRTLTPAHIRANQRDRLTALPPGAWPCNTLGNHDLSRVKTAFGDGVHDDALARLHAALLLTLKGTPFLYYGEEIGMTDYHFTNLDQVRDMLAVHQYSVLTETQGIPPGEALALALEMTRDRCRTPMQWSQAANAGFCPDGITPWLPVNPNAAFGVNVAHQVRQPDSMLSAYQRLLRLRRSLPALAYGAYTELLPDHAALLTFLRSDRASGQCCLVILNFSGEHQTIDITGIGEIQSILFADPQYDADVTKTTIDLAPYGVHIYALAPLSHT